MGVVEAAIGRLNGSSKRKVIISRQKKTQKEIALTSQKIRPRAHGHFGKPCRIWAMLVITISELLAGLRGFFQVMRCPCNCPGLNETPHVELLLLELGCWVQIARQPLFTLVSFAGFWILGCSGLGF